MAEFASSPLPDPNVDPMLLQRIQAANQSLQAGRQNMLLTDQDIQSKQLANQYQQAIQGPQINAMLGNIAALGGQASDDGAASQAPVAQAPAAAPSGQQAFAPAMAQSESGGNPGAVNSQGYSGQYQFGTGRLTDLGIYQPAPGENPNGNGWQGSFHVPGMPQIENYQDFLSSPDAQRVAMHAQMLDIHKRIAETPGASAFSPSGLTAVAHLGGVEGMQKFVASGGAYNPNDGRTSLLDYYNKFSGQNGMQALAAAYGHPDGPIMMADGSQGRASDPGARRAVQQMMARLNMAMLTPGGGGMRAVPGLQGALDNVAGPGGVALPSGQIVPAPGALQQRALASGAVKQGEIGPQFALSQAQADLERRTHAINQRVDTDEDNQRVRVATPGSTAFRPATALPPVNYSAPTNALMPQAPSAPVQAPITPPPQTMPATASGQQPSAALIPLGQGPQAAPQPVATPQGQPSMPQGQQGSNTYTVPLDPKVAAMEQYAKNVVPQEEAINKQAAESNYALNRIAQVRQAIASASAGGMPPGYFSPEMAQAAAAAKSMGIDLSTLGIDPKAVANAQSANEGLTQINGEILKRMFPTRITDSDVRTFGKSLPNYGMDPASLPSMLDQAQQTAQYDIDKGLAMNRYRVAQGHSVGFEPQFVLDKGYGPNLLNALKSGTAPPPTAGSTNTATGQAAGGAKAMPPVSYTAASPFQPPSGEAGRAALKALPSGTPFVNPRDGKVYYTH